MSISRESKVVVYGYTQQFAVNPDVRVFWNGKPVGSVKKDGLLSFDIDTAGKLSFKCNMRKAALQVPAGRVTNVKISWSRITGKMIPQLVDLATPELPDVEPDAVVPVVSSDFDTSNADQLLQTSDPRPEERPLEPPPEGGSASESKSASGRSSEVSADPLQQLRRLAELRDGGVITEEEFNNKKTELLSRI
jgi:hypothetical protein